MKTLIIIQILLFCNLLALSLSKESNLLMYPEIYVEGPTIELRRYIQADNTEHPIEFQGYSLYQIIQSKANTANYAITALNEITREVKINYQMVSYGNNIYEVNSTSDYTIVHAVKDRTYYIDTTFVPGDDMGRFYITYSINITKSDEADILAILNQQKGFENATLEFHIARIANERCYVSN